jgi:putative hemolysin
LHGPTLEFLEYDIMLIFLIGVSVALCISALCSLMEAAVLSLTPTQVADLSKRNPKVGAIWQGFKTRIDRPIAVILILNTTAHTIGATIAGAEFEGLFGKTSLIWFSLLFTYVMLQFTEVLPKTLGVQYNRRLAPILTYPLVFLIRVFSPFLWFIHLINRPFERKQQPNGKDPTLEEIAALAGLARLSKLIGPHQERIIHGASRLSGMSVADVMITAAEITFLSADRPLSDALLVAHNDPHTRFPIHEKDDRDRILGYVNFKEMVYWSRTNPSDPGLHGIIRPVQFVAPTEPATNLLKLFVDLHQHMAIVRSTEGKTLGLVTLEDLIEELVGELEDEFDRLPRMLHSLSGGSWMIGGGVSMRILAEQLPVESTDPDSTVSAWLIQQFGRVPKPNEVFRTDKIEFTVRRTRRGKIFEVYARKKQEVTTPIGLPSPTV